MIHHLNKMMVFLNYSTTAISQIVQKHLVRCGGKL